MPVETDNTLSAKLGDVDGDGDIDVVFGNASSQNRLHLNNGNGVFTDVTALQLPVDSDSTRAASLGDVDGDDDLDIVFGNGGRSRLYLNNGSGAFSDVTVGQMQVAGDTYAVQLGDVDGDGDLDAVFGNDFAQNRLYLNDGSATFSDVTTTHMPVDSDLTRAVLLGDVDSDGDLDIVSGNYYGQNRLYVNDGGGVFADVTAAVMPVHSDSTLAATVGDVDRDGDLDIVFANGSSLCCPQNQNRLYLNDGSGTFSDVTGTQMPVDNGARSVELGDVDGDGDLDIVGNSLLYLNDGSGNFFDVTATQSPGFGGASVALGDVDGDGDLDIVDGVGGFWNTGRNRLYTNLQRQIHAPFLARLGRPYTLEIYARYGVPRLVDVALPYVSAATAQIPLPPFGTVGIDPAFAIPLAPFVIPQPGGVGSVTEMIPNNPGLVGCSIHAQALLLQWPTAACLTNVTSDRILQ